MLCAIAIFGDFDQFGQFFCKQFGNFRQKWATFLKVNFLANFCPGGVA
jgi:hypothetical protein